MATNGTVAAVFDKAKAYLPWEVDGKFTADGREQALLEYIFDHPDLDTFRNNPPALLRAIDHFARTHTGLINVGETKGSIVTDTIAKHAPSTVIELGGYIGYSAILFGDAMKRAGGKQYYSVEKSPLFAAVATMLIDLAGLRDHVRVVIGTGAQGIQRLYDSGLLRDQLGMTFFDHHKPNYTADLKRLESLGLIGKGTVLVADNMILPGNPPYHEWVNASPEEKKKLASEATEDFGKGFGKPELVYKSKFIESYEPSGQVDAMEITICEG